MSWFSRHYLVIIMALLVGLLSVAPQLLIWKNLSSANLPYVPVQLNDYSSDVAHFYLPRARDVADGHFPPEPRLLNPLPPLLAGSLIALFDNTNIGYLAAIFLFSSLLFIVFYFLGHIVTRDKLWSYFVGFLGSLTPAVLLLPRAFLSIDNFLNIFLKNFAPLVQTALPFLFHARFDYPLLTEIIYIPAIAFIYLFWKNPSRNRAIAAAVFTGFLFYTYFHYWVYLIVALGLLFSYTIIFLRRDVERVKHFWLLVGVLAAMAVPYFVNYAFFQSAPWAADFVNRLGYEIGRGFRLASIWPDYLVYFLMAGIVYAVYWRKNRNRGLAIMFWLLLLAAMIVFQLQLITGFVPFPGHFRRAISPILFLILLSLGSEWLKRFRIAPLILVVAIAALPLKKLVNAALFIRPQQKILNQFTFNQDIYNSWLWINQNLSGEPKVLSNSFLTSIYLMNYTSSQPFLPHGGLKEASNFDLEERYLLANKLFGVSEEILRQRLSSAASDDYFYLYMLYFRDKSFDFAFASSDKSIPQAKIDELVRRYGNTQADWRDSGADYVYYGPWERQFSQIDLSLDENLELVYKNEAVEIYKIK